MSDKPLSYYSHIEEHSWFEPPLLPATSNVPNWYKEMPLTINGDPEILIDGFPNSTVKACSPFLDALTAGYTLVLSSDVLVRWEYGLPHISWRGERKLVTTHSAEQIDRLPTPAGHHSQVFKWHNEFVIETPKEYSLWCTHPVNRFDLPFTVISGFVDSDVYPMSIHFPFFLRDGWSGIIEKGTPIAQLFPVKRDSWKLAEKPSLTRKENFIRSERYKTRIKRAYKYYFWKKKSYK